MVAKIKRINDKSADIDIGKMYDRKLVNENNVKKYLRYNDEIGNLMIDDAIYMAQKKYEFSKSNMNVDII